jgi:hypothetical protein
LVSCTHSLVGDLFVIPVTRSLFNTRKFQVKCCRFGNQVYTTAVSTPFDAVRLWPSRIRKDIAYNAALNGFFIIMGTCKRSKVKNNIRTSFEVRRRQSFTWPQYYDGRLNGDSHSFSRPLISRSFQNPDCPARSAGFPISLTRFTVP